MGNGRNGEEGRFKSEEKDGREEKRKRKRKRKEKFLFWKPRGPKLFSFLLSRVRFGSKPEKFLEIELTSFFKKLREKKEIKNEKVKKRLLDHMDP